MLLLLVGIFIITKKIQKTRKIILTRNFLAPIMSIGSGYEERR